MLKNYSRVMIPNEFAKPFSEFNKQDINGYFNWFINVIPERLSVLSILCADYFVLDYSIESFSGVYFFLKENVNYKTRSNEEINIIKNTGMQGLDVDNKVLDENTISICFDLGIYFGETLLKNNRELKWKTIELNKNVDYGNPVIKGNTKMTVNPRRLFETNAYKFVEAKEVDENRIIDLFEYWLKVL